MALFFMTVSNNWNDLLYPLVNSVSRRHGDPPLREARREREREREREKQSGVAGGIEPSL